jgi:hypothetical protein
LYKFKHRNPGWKKERKWALKRPTLPVAGRIQPRYVLTSRARCRFLRETKRPEGSVPWLTSLLTLSQLLILVAVSSADSFMRSLRYFYPPFSLFPFSLFMSSLLTTRCLLSWFTIIDANNFLLSFHLSSFEAFLFLFGVCVSCSYPLFHTFLHFIHYKFFLLSLAYVHSSFLNACLYNNIQNKSFV